MSARAFCDRSVHEVNNNNGQAR